MCQNSPEITKLTGVACEIYFEGHQWEVPRISPRNPVWPITAAENFDLSIGLVSSKEQCLRSGNLVHVSNFLCTILAHAIPGYFSTYDSFIRIQKKLRLNTDFYNLFQSKCSRGIQNAMKPPKPQGNFKLFIIPSPESSFCSNFQNTFRALMYFVDAWGRVKMSSKFLLRGKERRKGLISIS